MHRIDSATARENVNGAGKSGFSDNADLPQHDATYVTPEWCNAIQEEIANAIEAAGVTLDKNDNTQLAQAVVGLVKPLVQAIYHVGSWHGTDNLEYNPALVLLPFFGYETIWRLRPFVPNGISTMGQPVKQISTVTEGAGKQLSSTRIWQRMPDDWVEPTWSLVSNNNVEGAGRGAVHTNAVFTLTTTGVPVGTQYQWQVHSSSELTKLDGMTSGTLTIGINGTAILSGQPNYSFTSSSDAPKTLKISIVELNLIASVMVHPTFVTPTFIRNPQNNKQAVLKINLINTVASYQYTISVTGSATGYSPQTWSPDIPYQGGVELGFFVEDGSPNDLIFSVQFLTVNGEPSFWNGISCIVNPS